MRRFILAGLVLVSAAAVFDVPVADAQVSSGRNPWCLRRGASWDCTYYSFQQCNESGRHGLDGMCVQNPEYRGGRQSRNPRQEPQGTWGWGGGRW